MSKSEENRRVYVGNLSAVVDEYALVKLFSKHGVISDINFLFHKTGPLRGQPRGYAFVEFAQAKEAQMAIAELDDKPLRGKKLVVTLANDAPTTPQPARRTGKRVEVKPTTLSLLKGGKSAKSTADKIAALESKLGVMERDEFAPPREDEEASTSDRPVIWPPRDAQLPPKPLT